MKRAPSGITPVGREQFLGESPIDTNSNSYRIEYSEKQIKSAERRTADLIVRAYDELGNVVAESDIVFNAGDSQRIDLVIEPPVDELVPIPNNEFDYIGHAIAPLLGDTLPVNLTDRDVQLLIEEFVRQDRHSQFIATVFRSGQRLVVGALTSTPNQRHRELLQRLFVAYRRAHQLEVDIEIPAAASYVWLRNGRGPSLDDLLIAGVGSLIDELHLAMVPSGNSKAIIRDISTQLPEIRDRIRGLQFERGQMVSHRRDIVLVNQKTEQPLPGYGVEVLDPAAPEKERDLGSHFTDARGRFSIRFALSAEASFDSTREFMLTISDEDQLVTEHRIKVRVDQDKPLIVPVNIVNAEPVLIAEIAPTDMAELLRTRGFTNLDEVLDSTELVEEAKTDPTIRAILSKAQYKAVFPDISDEQQAAFARHEFHSPFDVGRLPRSEFLARFADRGAGLDRVFSDVNNAIATHAGFQRTAGVLHHATANSWVASHYAPPDDGDNNNDPLELDMDLFWQDHNIKCGCQDCESAISPAAYLAHLLRWSFQHVHITSSITGDERPIDLRDLHRQFRQPFGELPTSCEAVQQRMRQVRIAVEVLWKHLEGLNPPPSLDTFRQQYSNWKKDLYRTIITNLGIGIDQLRTATLDVPEDNPMSEAIAYQRSVIAQMLGINETNLSSTSPLLIDVELPGTDVDELDDLQALFGYRATSSDPFTDMETPILVGWQRERLEEVWQSLDWSSGDYAGQERTRPYIDPAIIDQGYLREPLDQNPAFELLQDRITELNDYRSSLPDPTGGVIIESLLRAELGIPDQAELDRVRDVYATMRSGDRGQAEREAATLNVTLAGFVHLMQMDERQQSNQPVGLEGQLNTVWSTAYDILTSAFRHTRFSAWIATENGEDDPSDPVILLGAKTFWRPVVESESELLRNPWIATADERLAWSQQLKKRNERPIIDPNQITVGHVTLFEEADPLQITGLLETRSNWVQQRHAGLVDSRVGQATDTERFAATMAESSIGVGMEIFQELAAMEFEGIELKPRLEQLNLSLASYRFLAELHQLVSANGPVPDDKWQAVDEILVQVEKWREYSEWNEHERSVGIVLHPNNFRAHRDDELSDLPVRSPWLHDELAHFHWLSTLESRGEQYEAIDVALAKAVDEAEEHALPRLRDLLIEATQVTIGPHGSRANALDKLLLIDMQISGCHMTTRISQAITTLQRFVRGLHSQEHVAELDDFSLVDPKDYETVWPTIGKYATWRAFMLAYLFPENLLLTVAPQQQTHGFRKLKQELPSLVDPDDACRVAEEYSSYLRDVYHLQVQATCRLESPIPRESHCVGTPPRRQSRVHMFALSTVSGRVYTNSYRAGFSSQDTLDTWRPLEQLSDVLEIVVAIPRQTTHGRKMIALFVKTYNASRIELQVVHVEIDDLESSLSKSNKAKEIKVPTDGITDFTARVATSSNRTDPMLIAVRTIDGIIHTRLLDQNATGLLGDTWTPLFGPLIADRTSELNSVIHRGGSEYAILVSRGSGANRRVWFRLYTIRENSFMIPDGDDGRWREVAMGYVGAFSWPDSSDVFVLHGSNVIRSHSVIGETVPFLPLPNEVSEFSVDQLEEWINTPINKAFLTVIIVNVHQLEIWLNEVAGVSLEQFRFAPDVFISIDSGKDDEDGEDIIKRYYLHRAGNLKQLLAYADDTSVDGHPGRPGGWGSTEAVERGVRKAKRGGVREFWSSLRASPTNSSWRVANAMVKRFSGKSLTEVLLRIIKREEPTVFVSRGTGEARKGGEFPADSLTWDVAANAGDEDSFFTHDVLTKHIVSNSPNAPFRLRLQRKGDELFVLNQSQVAPFGPGPFTITPLERRDDLLDRKGDVKGSYELLATTPNSVSMHPKEAFNLVPLYLGAQLQRSGHFSDALLWFRQVFDYLQAVPSRRKIDHSLVMEESMPIAFDNFDNWLSDPNNPHGVAMTRRNTSTRHVLLVIVRCLISYADALFSKDKADDLSRAKELYVQALGLLSMNILTPKTSPCSDIIGHLEIAVDEDAVGEQLNGALNGIDRSDDLGVVVAAMNQISAGNTSSMTRRVREFRSAIPASIPTRRDTLTNALDSSRTVRESFATRAISKPRLRELFAERAREGASHALAEIRAAERFPTGDEGGPSSNGSAARNEATPIPEGMNFEFCIPHNPLVASFRIQAENNLLKLRTCRNIAGLLRDLDPYGQPIGFGSGLVSVDGSQFTSRIEAPASHHRYSTLIARAKELVGIAQQIETAYQSAIEAAERDAMTLLQAEQSIELSSAHVRLQDIQVARSRIELTVAKLQEEGSVLRESTYSAWIDSGQNEHETEMLAAYRDAGSAQVQASRWRAVGQAAQAMIPATQMGLPTPWEIAGHAARSSLAATAQAAAIAEGVYNERAIEAQTQAQVSSVQASFERRKEEWQLQRGLANVDRQVADQQVQISRKTIQIAEQEKLISEIQQTHALDVLELLRSRVFDEEMYRWIADILGDVYRFFLQEAASVARVAESRLSFDRLEAPRNVIQSDYWSDPKTSESSGSRRSEGTERQGITGSARLLKSIYELDQYAFETQRRKQRLALTLDLDQLYPIEFQRLRDSGVLLFETPMSLIDEQLPGHYMCTIEQVNATVVALVPPTAGIRASLSAAGVSNVVVGGNGGFRQIRLTHGTERIALTTPVSSSGSVMELQSESTPLALPFQGLGFNTRWELRMPKASNVFDFNTISTVILNFQVSAFHSYEYEQQVLRSLDRRVRANRAFRFRQEFSDAFYDLHNPDQLETPFVVRFRTRREDFPHNVDHLRIAQAALYFVQDGEDSPPITIDHLHFRPVGFDGFLGGAATTVESIISTRRGNGSSWLPLIGQSPVGEWELALPDDEETRTLFNQDNLKDIVLALAYDGERPPWPR